MSWYAIGLTRILKFLMFEFILLREYFDEQLVSNAIRILTVHALERPSQ